jgi:4-carboxymuconolactone decarboxylase
MEKSRYQKGLEKLSEVDGQAGENVINSLQDIAPGLSDYLIEFAFGDIYCRDGLSLQEREIISLTTLLTQGGCEPQLKVHINGALNVGLSPEKIVEVIIHCVPYTGFPRVLNAVTAAKQVFAERGVSVQ